MDENYVQVLIDTITKKEETLRKILEITRRQELLSKQEVYSSDGHRLVDAQFIQKTA